MPEVIEHDIARRAAGGPKPDIGGIDSYHRAQVPAVKWIVADHHLACPERDPRCSCPAHPFSQETGHAASFALDLRRS